MKHAQEITAARDRFIAQHGPWTGHRIHLGQEVYTCEDVPQYCLSYRLAQHLQIMADLGFGNLTGLRILDLACMEGAFSIEFARRGASVLGIEGRPVNLARAKFAAEMIGFSETQCQFIINDVRDIESLGQFHIVLCAGILYHLTAEDAVKTLRQIAATGAALTVIDTHISSDNLGDNRFNLSAPKTVTLGNDTYRGRWYPEFPPGATAESKMKYSTGSALDNDHSFWFYPPDLRRIVEAVGFRCYQAFLDDDRTVIAGRR
jgi:SAM-dependent methyltransferase